MRMSVDTTCSPITAFGTATSANWRRANSTRRCLTVWTVCKKLHACDILEAVLDETDTVPYQVIMSVAHALQNILEDGYVDARYSYEFPGSPRQRDRTQ